jgi:hypothetical protein
MEGCLPGLGADATLSPDKASGGRWKHVMEKVKSGVPKRFHRNLDDAGRRTGRRWRG